jgi:hypothetical protein
MKSDAGIAAGALPAEACVPACAAGSTSPISANAAASVGRSTAGRGTGAACTLSLVPLATNAAALAAAPFKNRRRPTGFFFDLLVGSDTVFTSWSWEHVRPRTHCLQIRNRKYGSTQFELDLLR